MNSANDTIILANETTTESTTSKTKYQVISVEKTAAPEGLTGNNWFRYEIGVGSSKLVGNKPGTLNAVTEHAHTLADDMNNRASGNKSMYTPRVKK